MERVFIGLNYNVNIDIQFSPEYIFFGTDHDIATEEIILIKSTIYTYLQEGKFISFEGTKHLCFKYTHTNTRVKFLHNWAKYLDVVPDIIN